MSITDDDLVKLKKAAALEARRQREAARRATKAELEAFSDNVDEAAGFLGDVGAHVTTRADYAAGIVEREAGPAIPGFLTGAVAVAMIPVVGPFWAIGGGLAALGLMSVGRGDGPRV